ncbi:hypothetical protein P171DRAFT_53125 [Karstenula rhodostoma CBS 690.94]|uniref:Secreted protein n=1 Tax=Karstenula rhodostoma CBS 690.94 TaxID=1392251 RepID=A0A9P4PFA4_9PLEO|nr:hypothetical protein P171DRAFT_53125 [Karstenula rhodostoma CBS 690.94]
MHVSFLLIVHCIISVWSVTSCLFSGLLTGLLHNTTSASPDVLPNSFAMGSAKRRHDLTSHLTLRSGLATRVPFRTFGIHL